jgi:two-component system chemotaxis sensor kinase CheA
MMNLDPEVTPEELKVFLEEANEQIELLDEDIVRMEKEGENPELIQEIFRAAHTLKGSSAMVGHQAMAAVTHTMESLLDRVRNNEISITTSIIDALLSGLDAIKTLKNEITTSEDSGLDIETVIAALEAATSSRTVPVAAAAGGETALALDDIARQMLQAAVVRGHHAYYVEFAFAENSEWKAIRCLQCLNEIKRISEIVASSPTEKEIDAETVGPVGRIVIVTTEDKDTVQGIVASISEIVKVQVSDYSLTDSRETSSNNVSELGAAPTDTLGERDGVPINKPKPTSPDNSQNLQSVKVDVQVLDNLMNIVEELVIDRSNIGQVGRMLEAKYAGDALVRQLAQTSDHIIKIIGELQESIMQVRMIPIGAIFSRFPRMVRDLAHGQKKEIDFVVSGEDTELDRSLIEQVRDPIIHLLRNSVDHGIESPESRIAANKPKSATISLTAAREQSHIVITVEDDGGGISAEKIREAAVRKGFMAKEQVDKLSDAEAINLIYKPGMSTAKKTTEISGRGVGLDIVRSNVENLGGSIILETKPGQGTKFTIRLPLTVAIVQGLLVTAGGTVYVLPLPSVIETVAIKPSDIFTIRRKEIIRRLDNLIPVVRLNEKFGSNNGSGIAGGTRQKVVVIAKAGESMIGLMVDSLMEPQEIVVKSLGKYMGDIEGIAGATILGDGRVALILDVASLVRIARNDTKESELVETVS